jgi:predicted oxidoreductase
MIDLERGRAREALKRCRELQPISAKMGEGSEIPFAETLEALAKSMLGETEAEASLEQALVRLRAADTKGQLAYALTLAAQLDAERGAAARAQQRLEEAIHAAEVVERHSEGALARALLARLAPARGGNGPAAACLDEFSQYLGTPLGLSSRARAALASLEAQIGEAIPTAATTPGA